MARPGWAPGLTERKLVRRKKNPKIRPELTLIAFLHSSHSDQTSSMSLGDNWRLDGN